MKVKLTRDIEPIRNKALARIDREAEATRGLFMTLGSGQAMVYNQKRDEAENFMRDQDTSPAEIPHLVAEAAMNQISLFDQAVIYLTMRQQWLTISPMIEERRLHAKAAVAGAATPAEIEIAATVDWNFWTLPPAADGKDFDMTLRIASTTQENGESAAWQPASAFTVQGEVPANSSAVLTLYGRVDANAPFKPIEGTRLAANPMIHCIKLYEVKLVWTGNRDELPLQAWSDA